MAMAFPAPMRSLASLVLVSCLLATGINAHGKTAEPGAKKAAETAGKGKAVKPKAAKDVKAGKNAKNAKPGASGQSNMSKQADKKAKADKSAKALKAAKAEKAAKNAKHMEGAGGAEVAQAAQGKPVGGGASTNGVHGANGGNAAATQRQAAAANQPADTAAEPAKMARPAIRPVAAAAPNSPAYQDRVLKLSADDSPLDDAPTQKYDSSGLPRAWSVEATSDHRNTSGQYTGAHGLKISGYTDTRHYGSLSGNVNLQQPNGGKGLNSSLIVRQIGMPFDGGWKLDNTLGATNLPVLDLARASQRITLTTPAMQGISSQLRNQNGLGLQAAAGRAGQISGYPVAGFALSQGQYTMAGAYDQVRTADGRWHWGGMVANAQDVNSVLAQTAAGQGRMNAQGVYLSAQRTWGGAPMADSTYAQVNAVSGSNTGADLAGTPNAPAQGLWVEGGFARGAHRNNWGVFRLDSGLAWLDLPMANDLQGGYWRHGWRTRQWSTETGLELLRSVSGTTPDGYFANGSTRYQFSSVTSFGVGASVRRYGIQSQSVQAFSQFVNDLGSSRAQVDVGSTDSGERLMRLQLDHDWTKIQALRLSTAVSVDKEQRLAGDTQGQGLAINADWTLSQGLSLNQSLQGRWTTDQSQYSLNASVSWRIAPQWSFQTNLYAIHGNNNSLNLTQSPLAIPFVPPNTTQDSGVYVMLRYDQSAGRPLAPTGGSPGSAAGRLAGTVFLDENKNGKREAGEKGAGSVTVLLDGRFAVETDNQGRFEFAYVLAGPHVLSVISDNLPLPWMLEKDGRTEVTVFTRDSTLVDIGAIRQ